MYQSNFDEYVKPILKKILLVVVLIILALLVGQMIGFAIGGQNPFAVFLPSTWSHIINFLQ
ncbi:DNA-directed RNA polymerase subunit beta [Latilactobacillus graminis]|uniref:DNA-directed RNA polymerase subunit beta n=2 Tax=Latilactobacillus graminis TaxID=60519 RepID=A0AA89I0U9_9LACO|nr:DNA-directed RNA polymerase subunit beta [Latilactobacillus graminis]KRM22360.1 hypothetical protein FC90_GL000962 [Latilactobacillus graminis DSM 20719]QFP79466.1 DNA-directed RNA polymerase subunit beta [Latilactobacillus graminis]